MNDFVSPTIEYAELSPLLIVLGVALLGLVVEAVAPRSVRYLAQTLLALGGLVLALVAAVLVAGDLQVWRADVAPDAEPGSGAEVARGTLAIMDTIAIDGPTVFLWILLLVLGITGVMLFAERLLEGGVTAFSGQAAALPGTDAERQASTRGMEHTEVYPLLLFSLSGMMLFLAANDLLTMFVALEVLSLPLYLLSGLARRRRLLSQEAALKYFLLGAFSSGFFLYGVALVYGYAGTMQFAGISEAIQNSAGNRPLLILGVGLLAVGLLFKVGAVPFHNWTPDVYQGAPTPVTAFMSAATKVAAFGAMARLFYVALGPDRWSWQPMLWVVAILSMVVGSIVAIVQTDMKRLLAYSAIAHAGFIITGILGVEAAADLAVDQLTSLQAVLFYLTAYAFVSVGGFAVVMLVRDASGEATGITRWVGLGKESPLVAGVFAFFLLAMAGIPFTSGFIGKWVVFTSALSAGAWPVVIIAVLASAVAAFFYMRVIWLMYFTEPEEGAAPAVTYPSVLTSTVVALCAAVTLVLGVMPGWVLDLAGSAGSFIR